MSTPEVRQHHWTCTAGAVQKFRRSSFRCMWIRRKTVSRPYAALLIIKLVLRYVNNGKTGPHDEHRFMTSISLSCFRLPSKKIIWLPTHATSKGRYTIPVRTARRDGPGRRNGPFEWLVCTGLSSLPSGFRLRRQNMCHGKRSLP